MRPPCRRGRRSYSACSRASSTKSARAERETRQPTMHRAYASSSRPAGPDRAPPGGPSSAGSPPRSLSSPQSSRSPPTARRARPDAPKPSARHAHALQENTSLISSWPQSLKSWSLRQNRYGSYQALPVDCGGRSRSYSDCIRLLRVHRLGSGRHGLRSPSRPSILQVFSRRRNGIVSGMSLTRGMSGVGNTWSVRF